jgi:hypothetical protein
MSFLVPAMPVTTSTTLQFDLAVLEIGGYCIGAQPVSHLGSKSLKLVDTLLPEPSHPLGVTPLINKGPPPTTKGLLAIFWVTCKRLVESPF